MDFADQVLALAARVPKQIEFLQTEEATKTALVMPFINALGYNVFDPTEVVPEFTADVGIKKGEKVDYAIMKDGVPIILFECKTAKAPLTKEAASQLYRYFAVTPARIGILTNGVVYRFFMDLDEPNKMDERPFLEVNMLDIDRVAIGELKRFTKSTIDLDAIVDVASDLKYTRAVKGIFAEQLQDPTDDFVRFFIDQVHGGRVTKGIRDSFRDIVRRALSQYVSDRVSDRLKNALVQEESTASAVGAGIGPVPELVQGTSEPEVPEDGIVTTQDELDGFYMVKAICASVVDPARVVMRDTKSYCGILFDDNNRKPIVRLRFNSSNRYLGLFDENKSETRVPLEAVQDIYKHADAIRSVVQRWAQDA